MIYLFQIAYIYIYSFHSLLILPAGTENDLVFLPIGKSAVWGQVDSEDFMNGLAICCKISNNNQRPDQ